MITLMTSKNSSRIAVLAVAFALLAGVPHGAFASTSAVARSEVHAGNVVAVDVYFDTEGKSLNAVTGTVVLGGTTTLNVTDMSVAGSALDVWPRMPSLGTDGRTITFTGGTTNGFSGTHELLFTVFMQATQAGTVNVGMSGVLGYLADGSGNAVTYADETNDVAVLAQDAVPTNAEKQLFASDTTPPAPFTIELLQDSTLYNGMKFLSFPTTDAQSGVDYYAVTEGSLPVVRSGSTYVLQNQTSIVPVTVTAYDKAGNKRTETFPESHTFNWPFVTVAVIVLAGIALVVHRRKGSHQHHAHHSS